MKVSTNGLKLPDVDNYEEHSTIEDFRRRDHSLDVEGPTIFSTLSYFPEHLDIYTHRVQVVNSSKTVEFIFLWIHREKDETSMHSSRNAFISPSPT